MPISDAVRETIKEEEILRREIRQQLESEKTRNKNSLVVFFNTSLGLWMLSTLAVGFITFGYAKAEAYFLESAANERRLERVGLEITGRVIGLQRALSQDHVVSSLLTRDDVINLWDAFMAPPTPVVGTKLKIYAVLPEFKDSSLASLGFEYFLLNEELKTGKDTSEFETEFFHWHPADEK